MKNSTSFALRMISIPVVAGLLSPLWVTAANAADLTCKSHTLTQSARKGEQVKICEIAKPQLAFRTSSPKALVAKLPATVHGSCRITERLVTLADGSQHIARHTVCQGS